MLIADRTDEVTDERTEFRDGPTPHRPAGGHCAGGGPLMGRTNTGRSRLTITALGVAIAAIIGGGAVVLVANIGQEDGAAERAATAPPSTNPPEASDTDLPRQQATDSPPGDGSAPGATTSSTPHPGDGDSRGKVVKLGDHPLLTDPDLGLPNLACELPEWDNTQAGAKRFFRAATRCLDAAWEPVLRAHDLPFTPPRLYFPSGAQFSSDCGTIGVGIHTAAYYCEGELFLPWRGLQLEQYPDNPGVYLALIAHEYGHHVQEMAGIMDAVWQQIYDAGEESDEGLEMSRRKELQAQCFSGMFLGSHVDRGGSIDRAMYDKAWQDQDTRGDDTSGGDGHGSNENYARWWRTGAMDNRVADCNTFTASTKDVR